MSINYTKALRTIQELKKEQNILHLLRKLRQRPSSSNKKLPPIPEKEQHSAEGQKERLQHLKNQTKATLKYLNTATIDHNQLQGNIENFIGMAQIPVGIAGPLAINGTAANGSFYIPLATTEGALVASYNRGAKAATLSGGITAACLIEGVQRSPLFKFQNILEAGKFVLWTQEQIETFKKIIQEKSNHAKLDDLKTNIEGNHVILTFEYLTGDAAGQNMVTICTEAICQYILHSSPVKPVHWFIESNYSGDKKATALAFSYVRGKKVTAEVTVPQKVVKEILKTTPAAMAEYWQSATVATLQSGAIGAQGHIANCLAALFIACGQDAACVAEASVGVGRMEITQAGDLYAALTLPNLIVGTIGGGTHLPTQRECLELMGCYGAGKSKKFAEICTATALAGELSIAAAVSAGHFTTAHQNLGRKAKK